MYLRKRLSNFYRTGSAMVSLKDIAEKCDVSVATVSKALNDQKDIGADTKRRIRTAADELGYSPNAAARALKTGQSFNLGVLFKDDAGSGLTHEYFSGVLNGFKEEAEAVGYDITFINNRFGNRNASYTEHCRSRNFDGVVVVCASWDERAVRALLDDKIPKVTIDYIHHRSTAICSNNEKGIEDLLKFVYDRGHRAIAYIHGQDYSYVTRDRIKSFLRTAEELRIPIKKEYIREAKYLDGEASAIETRKLLGLKNPPTCIFYPDDTSLIGSLPAFREKGVEIPKDVSVVGYDGSGLSQRLSPRICTICQNSDAIGREAAKRLIRLIEHPRTSLIERVVIEGALLPGDSVAKLSSKK